MLDQGILYFGNAPVGGDYGGVVFMGISLKFYFAPFIFFFARCGWPSYWTVKVFRADPGSGRVSRGFVVPPHDSHKRVTLIFFILPIKKICLKEYFVTLTLSFATVYTVAVLGSAPVFALTGRGLILVQSS